MQNYDNPSFSLTDVVVLFNGVNAVSDIISLVPTSLRPFVVDIIVWLLRWHLIVEVHQYLMWICSDDRVVTPTAQLADAEGSTSIPQSSRAASERRSSSLGSDGSEHFNMYNEIMNDDYKDKKDSQRKQSFQEGTDTLQIPLLNEDEMSIIRQISGFLDGSVDVEDISFQTGIDLEDILSTSQKHPNVMIITCPSV